MRGIFSPGVLAPYIYSIFKSPTIEVACVTMGVHPLTMTLPNTMGIFMPWPTTLLWKLTTSCDDNDRK